MVSPASPAPHKPANWRAQLPGMPLFTAVLAAAVLGAGFVHVVQPETQLPAQVDLGQLIDDVDEAFSTPSAAEAAVLTASMPPEWLRRITSDSPLATLSELQALKAGLIANAPDPASGQSARTERMIFIDATLRFLQLRGDGGDTAELRALAALIEPALSERVQRGEVPLSEARLLKAQLLELQLDDAAVRQAELARWSEALAASAAR